MPTWRVNSFDKGYHFFFGIQVYQFVGSGKKNFIDILCFFDQRPLFLNNAHLWTAKYPFSTHFWVWSGTVRRSFRQNLAGFSQNSLFELGKVFYLPFAVIIFLFDCSPKVFYGSEGGYSRWFVVFGDVSDSFVFEKLLGCISIVSQRQIRPEVVENDCCAFPG